MYRLPLPVVREPEVGKGGTLRVHGRTRSGRRCVPSGQIAAQPLFTQEPQGMARSQRSLSLEVVSAEGE